MPNSDSKVDEWMLQLRDILANQQRVGQEHAEKLEAFLIENPRDGVRKIQEIYEAALDKAHEGSPAAKSGMSRGYLEALAGGPNETIPWLIYNSVGAVYPRLNREQKDGALAGVFEILDGINYIYVQNTHTPGIREPLLLADIKIARPYYWPGMDEGEELVKRYEYFSRLQRDLIDNDGLFLPGAIRSDFIVGYSLLRSGFCSFGESYVKVANKEFLGRVMCGIVGMRFGHAKTEEDIAKGTARLKVLLPKSLHERIEPLRKEGGWVTNPRLLH